MDKATPRSDVYYIRNKTTGKYDGVGANGRGARGFGSLTALKLYRLGISDDDEIIGIDLPRVGDTTITWRTYRPDEL